MMTPTGFEKQRKDPAPSPGLVFCGGVCNPEWAREVSQIHSRYSRKRIPIPQNHGDLC